MRQGELMRCIVGMVTLLVLGAGAAWADPPIASEAPVLRVAIYDHSEGTARGPKNLQRFLVEPAGFQCTRVKPEEIRAGCLKDFDILIVPGGSGSRQAANLQEEGREQVRQFVREGGGFVGICAGSYLATTNYSWSLGLLNAKVIDSKHWARGTGQVRLTVTGPGKQTLGNDDDQVEVYYGQGPLLGPGDKEEPAPYEPLALYADEIAKKGAPTGVMIGTTAIARGTFGQGRVLCFSPHLEVKDGPNQMVLEGVRWVGGAKQPATTQEVSGAR
jgi:hypothetical protein